MAERTKVVPNRCNGKVLEWKGAFGWIQPTEPIKHPAAAKNKGKIYLAQEDVEAELSGVGAAVSFFVYSDGKGLGAMNVRPGAVQKSKAVQQAVQKAQPAQPQKSKAVQQALEKMKGNAGAKPSVPGSANAAAKPGAPGAVRKSNAVYQAVQKMKGETPGTSAAKGTAGQVDIRKSSAVARAVEKMRNPSPASKTPASKAPVKGTAAVANGGAGGKTKVLPNRVTGKVKEWKGAFGWIVPDTSIAHPNAKKHGGKIYLAHEDVEVELSGIGATVSFFVYSDSNGLGAMNVRPSTASKPASTASKPANNKPAASKLGAALKVQQQHLKKQMAAKKAKQGAGASPGVRERITEDAVMGEIVEFRGNVGWIKLTEFVSDEIEDDKDIYCTKKDLVEGTPTKKGTVVTCHVYKDAKGFGVEEVSEA